MEMAEHKTNPNLMPDILTDLEALRESFLREARIYAKQSDIKDGDRPKDSTPWQQCCAISSGTYRVAAHELNKVIKKHKPKT